MRKLSLLFVIILTISSCEQDSILTEIEEFSIEQDSFAKRASNQEKVDVCHKGKIINVSVNAISAHQKHGDAVDMDGDGFFDQENSCSDAGVDCNDTNPDVNPGAKEIFTDDIDNNCNGVVGYIEIHVDYTYCTDCTAGTEGNYQNRYNGKCKFFPMSYTQPNDRWMRCRTEVEVYRD